MNNFNILYKSAEQFYKFAQNSSNSDENVSYWINKAIDLLAQWDTKFDSILNKLPATDRQWLFNHILPHLHKSADIQEKLTDLKNIQSWLTRISKKADVAMLLIPLTQYISRASEAGAIEKKMPTVSWLPDASSKDAKPVKYKTPYELEEGVDKKPAKPTNWLPNQ